MCNEMCIIFGATNLTKEEVEGKKIIEVGSYDMNASLRPIIESWTPAEYVGVDIKKGPGVDIVCGAEDIIERFGKESFDIVISTELLEHVKDWRKVILDASVLRKKLTKLKNSYLKWASLYCLRFSGLWHSVALRTLPRLRLGHITGYAFRSLCSLTQIVRRSI